MSDSPNPAAAPSAYPSPTPSTALWWQTEDWKAVFAALPILIAVASGWVPVLWMMFALFIVLSALFLGKEVLKS